MSRRTQVAPFINTSITLKAKDTSRGYLNNVTHGNHIENESIIGHVIIKHNLLEPYKIRKNK